MERRHRIVSYETKNGTALASRPSPLILPQNAATQPFNGGIEGLTKLCDGRFIAISEKAKFNGNKDTRSVWIGRGGTWRNAAYPAYQAFSPTGATTLPDCSVLVVERSFNLIEGVRARIVGLPAAAFEPGAVIATRELAYLAPPLSVDNMEGIAARKGANGETLVYLVSDNNFSGYQRTLLMMFELTRNTAQPVKSRSIPKSPD